MIIGQQAIRKNRVTADHITKYAEITGDYNPLHFDEEFAKKTKFGKIIVQGGITAGLLNALVAMDLPGPGTVFINQELQYLAPVYVNDILTAEAIVIKIHETKPVTTLAVEIKNQAGIIVLKGKCVCYTFK